MKSYTITVNGNVYDVTVEENGGSVQAAPAAAPKAAPKAPAAPKAAPKNAQGAGNIRVEAGAAGKVFKIEASVGQKVKRGDAVVINLMLQARFRLHMRLLPPIQCSPPYRLPVRQPGSPSSSPQ